MRDATFAEIQRTAWDFIITKALFEEYIHLTIAV